MEDYTDKRLQPRFPLKDTCPELVEFLSKYFRETGESELANQLQRTMVASWRIAKTPEQFFFIAFPVPVTTTQERMQMRLVPERRLEVAISPSTVVVDVDDFGEIFRFTIINWPKVHEQLRTHMLPETCGARFRFFREPAGLSQDDVAKQMKSRAGRTKSETTKRMNLSVSSICDIEADDSELSMCYSPCHIWHFSQVLGVTPQELLNVRSSELALTAPELVSLINKECVDRGITLEKFEDVVGWRLTQCINPPELLLNDMTLDGMKWLCKELCIDWARVIAGLN